MVVVFVAAVVFVTVAVVVFVTVAVVVFVTVFVTVAVVVFVVAVVVFVVAVIVIFAICRVRQGGPFPSPNRSIQQSWFLVLLPVKLQRFWSWLSVDPLLRFENKWICWTFASDILPFGKANRNFVATTATAAASSTAGGNFFQFNG